MNKTDDKKEVQIKTVRVDPDRHKKLKIAAAKEGKSLQEKLAELIDDGTASK